jgi:hypothetical protein
MLSIIFFSHFKHTSLWVLTPSTKSETRPTSMKNLIIFSLTAWKWKRYPGCAITNPRLYILYIVVHTTCCSIFMLTANRERTCWLGHFREYYTIRTVAGASYTHTNWGLHNTRIVIVWFSYSIYCSVRQMTSTVIRVHQPYTEDYYNNICTLYSTPQYLRINLQHADLHHCI